MADPHAALPAEAVVSAQPGSGAPSHPSSLAVSDTVVTFPAGVTGGSGRVVAVVAGPQAGTVGVVVDRTPFHPVDHTWPDQPADRGTLAGTPLLDCLTGALAADGTWQVGEQITARRTDPGLTWVVVHVLPEEAAPAVGAQVDLVVDAEFRRVLSRGHSACHLAALALNAAAAPFFDPDRDPGRRDSLGNPDLDSLAITLSRIEPNGALDEYRLGKSVRKKGLRSADLLAELPALQQRANDQLAAWTAAGGAVGVDTGGDERITARRSWRADLPPGRATIPCGGTHVSDLAEVDPVTVTYEPTDAGFRVLTRVDGPSPS